ncbi:hypothetical protein HD806DRAFT_501542 [Xylariaceae sp. AK1471]|nr:hypothetical protein HD806DRAFT_501542 [Xylariaceae sp. AK1471]
MSGIEVVGLILGVIPLVISGMEHYADGVSTLGRYRKYKLELKTLINILDTEKTKLMNTCEKLIIGLVPSWRIEAMIEDPFGEVWRDEEIQKKIRCRLWRSFIVFEETVKDVHAAIQEMVSRLGLQPDGKVKWMEGSALLRELKRTTFSLKKSSYDDVLVRIKDGIASLETLTAQNVELEPKRKVRSQDRLLSLLRETSKSIYRAVKSSLLCHEVHDLNLELAMRSANFIPQDEDEMVTKEFSFRIAISSQSISESVNQSTKMVQFWDEVIVKEMTASTPAVTGPPSPSLNPIKNSKAKTVRFWSQSTTAASSASALTVIQGHPTLVTEMADLTLEATLRVPGKQDTLLLSLCDNLRKAKKQQVQNCYGYIVDSMSTKRREYGIYRIEEAPDSEKWSTVSLRRVLESSTGQLPPLRYCDRLYLAVVLSSSILQLHQTPWLPDKLRSEDVVFVQRENIPLYKHAFVAKRVPGRDQSTTGWPMKAASICHNTTVLSLGILLIELILGKPLHGAGVSDKSETEFLSDYVAAQKLLNEVEELGGLNYGSAVRWCLNCHSFRHNLSLEDEGFRQEVYSSVVAPLEQDLRNSGA